MKIKKSAIIASILIVTLLLVGWFNGFFIWLVLESSRQHEEIGEIASLTPGGTTLPFSFPKSGRGWPFYIEDYDIEEYEDAAIKVWIKNTCTDIYTVTVRQVDTESTNRFSLSPGEEALIVDALLSDFLHESIKRNRLKPLSNESFTEWPPLLHIRSINGKPVRGILTLRSDAEITLSQAIRFYSEQPPDTL